MRTGRLYFMLMFTVMIIVTACKHKTNSDKGSAQVRPVFKGIYSCEPGAKLFQVCNQQGQFWVADSSKQLELQYSQIVNFEQAGQPVYIEVEGNMSKSVKNGDGGAYDSTLTVKKVIKITKDIPADCK
ncbi:hypothetical protein [Mucilaginibacter sp. dw_454]|uniref:hypothetical protein n=1 Tax=Mucilaginibacter sp. dw_454 TaxID=2720079 RepID=UPI001BD63739|nr:hypothetical protein [Mucilaginibacter sp. dw_454]